MTGVGLPDTASLRPADRASLPNVGELAAVLAARVTRVAAVSAGVDGTGAVDVEP